MKIYYQATGWKRFSEEDIYNEGCQPSTGRSSSGDDVFRGEDCAEVVEKCLSFCGGTLKDCERDSCDQLGRLDVCIMENAEGYSASTRELDKWRQGKFQLWNSIYTFIIRKITEEEVALLLVE